MPRTWIERLFDKMLLSYGKKFTDQWMGADPDKLIAHWADELATFSREELSRGYAALEARDWPPSLPEFKRMCRPPLDPMVAYYEAVNGVNARERGQKGEWSHPAIFWAAAGMAYDLIHLTYTAIQARWERALKEQMEKGEWAAIPEVAVALPAPGKGRTDREQAEKMVAQYMASAKPAEGRDDHTRWIGKILERAKRKDVTLPAIALRMAREALNDKTAVKA